MRFTSFFDSNLQIFEFANVFLVRMPQMLDERPLFRDNRWRLSPDDRQPSMPLQNHTSRNQDVPPRNLSSIRYHIQHQQQRRLQPVQIASQQL